jgi:tRNA1(Val) A37 N6-methylase TrmN6
MFLIFVATTIHLLSKTNKIADLCVGNGLLSPEEFELNEDDMTVKRILEVSKKEFLLRTLLEMND